jgi:hypothetical protein
MESSGLALPSATPRPNLATTLEPSLPNGLRAVRVTRQPAHAIATSAEQFC